MSTVRIGDKVKKSLEDLKEEMGMMTISDTINLLLTTRHQTTNEDILRGILKVLKEIGYVQKERLAFEKETDKKDREIFGKTAILQDKIIGKIGKDELLQNDVLKMLGIKMPIDIEDIEDIKDIEDEKEN